ncbi:cellobiose phosphorylase [Croceicoccus ponticola]|uniref:Cellobiose phosphorylase n=1 Tax=Croceicoccus ponticola TaxID=2217664 RepID=A0A437H1T7_9SPHN|nr:glucoamylase family protein [Croceicoccus ponticola]RVQ69590.1 cellobiose phosphorylase [Croceicoccus ponticola]
MADAFTDPVAAHGWETGKTLSFGQRQERPRAIAAWRSIERVGPWLSDATAVAAKAEPAVSSAAEWLLDNSYQVQRAMLLVHEDMPQGFYARLRPMTSGHAVGEPRILMLSHDLLHATHFQLSRESVLAYLEGYQTHHPLDIAELWALPAMLRIACIERLVAGFAVVFPPVPAPFDISLSSQDFIGAHEPADCVARAIANLGVISNIIWQEIFDHSSHVDRSLDRDPAAAYGAMDFDTRDACRQSVERIAGMCTSGEVEVADAAVAMAARHPDLPLRHVGYWLVDDGLVELEQSLGIVPPRGQRVARWLMRRPGLTYAVALFACGIVGLIPAALYLALHDASVSQWALGLVFSVLPATVLAVTVVNWLVTLTVPPRRLAKLDYSEGLDPRWPTVVAMPVIVGSVAEVPALLARLDAHWLANPGARGYVLLSDPADAGAERVPGDEAVETALQRGVRALNRQRGGGFVLLHRIRRHNPAQACWMAWERKRGKIDEFNRFLLTGDRSAFPVTAGRVDSLAGAKFVVTADADTRLPPGSVARLAGALAHPLNRPEFDDAGRVVSGYTVLQPRVEIAPHGSDTLFARLFGGDTAIDIYSRAVSDVYQDLTGTGNYVGKGIYDVAAFSRSLDRRIPENQLLSHDLWEGLHGRAALASDIVVYESFPESYAEYARRWHRWVRGDWQLLPWLFGRVPGPDGTRIANRLTLFDRLRIWDNMRRSLVPASVVLLLLAGWFVLPGSPLFWTAVALLVPGAWLFTDLVTGVARGRRRGVLTGTFRQAGEHLQRWALQVVFLLSDTVTALHAITVTLLRLRRGNMLLQWTSAAHINLHLARGNMRVGQWGATWSSPVVALAFVPLLAFDPHALPVALPLIALWLAAPEIGWLTARSRRLRIQPLGTDDRAYLRRIARRSWLFFERFAGPEDHWLPPDNHQEAPIVATAHRTSPTNIGMLAISALSAWRLGHIGHTEFTVRMRAMLDTLDRLEHWNGHILNWFDTRSLAPLEPRYVSTVDSGNLAVSLIVLASGCREIAASPAFGQQRWDGLDDCLFLLLEGLHDSDLGGPLQQQVRDLRRRMSAHSGEAERWPDMIADALAQMERIRDDLVRTLDQAKSVDPHSLHSVRDWLERSEHHLHECQRELKGNASTLGAGAIRELERIARRAEDMAEAMDFRPLYNPHRKLFHIGYDVTAQRIDQHYYDLLASEARLASYFAIAKRDVPPEHWFHLGRPIVKHRRELSLVSWNGSMFEYLMPSLFLRSDLATLLGETETAAVAIQKHYADSRDVPWGVSESGFASYGNDGAWRYRAFGVPALGLRRGLEDDLVIAPYATALALSAAPHEALTNLRRLARCGAVGRFGFHEALDFTPERMGDAGQPMLVRSYMAHHHGMSIAAIANALTDNAIVDWFHADRRMESVDLLLNERIPWELPQELERLETPPVAPVATALLPRPQAWEPDPGPATMVKLLGNGRLSLRLGTDGCGDLAWKGNVLTSPTGADRDRGQFLYLRDRAGGMVWSPTPAPMDGAAGNGAGGNGAGGRRVVFHPHKVEFRCHAGSIAASLDVVVSPSQEVEIRRLRLVNNGPETVLLDFASHADIALAEAGEWARHPAFARLFVEAEAHRDIDAISFTRRPRSPETPGLVMVQGLVASPDVVRLKAIEVSRRRTRERLGHASDFPRFGSDERHPGKYPLDPAAAFLAEITLPPHGEAVVALVTTVASLHDEALDLARRYGSLASLEWAEQDAGDSVRHDLRTIGLAPDRMQDAELLFSALVDPAGPRRPIDGPAAREDLWALGVSGDLPVLLLELGEEFDGGALRFVLAAHRLWHWRGAAVDLVLLHPGLPGYVEPLRDRIIEIMRDCGSDEYLGQRGGVTLVGSEQCEEQSLRALRKAADAMLRDDGGDIAGQLRERVLGRIPVPLFHATGPTRTAHQHADGGPVEEPLSLMNGYGGFTAHGDYRIELQPGDRTPAPWANVLANPEFGTIVTEAGLGFTFAANSGENRLTPWHNDAQRDPQGEALYLRDEETGDIWSVAPQPAGDGSACHIEHGLGETRWLRNSLGLGQEMRCFVAPDDPVKVVTLRLTESTGVARRVTATFFADWLLGTNAGEPAPLRESRYHPELAALLGRNHWQRDFQDRVAFLAGMDAPHSLTTSRADFLGSPPDWRRPAGLHAWGMGERAENGGADAIAALQFHLDIPAGEMVELTFLLGQVSREDQLADMLNRWRAPGAIGAARTKLGKLWDRRCHALQVKTPDSAFDLMINRWLPYQTVSSRLFARAGFYQASGAYGYRDQLQDVLSLMLPEPALAREQILRAAEHQFEAGDVLHWWHPPSGKGVRTRYSDDLLWLPHAVARYVGATGDAAILDVRIPFLEARELASDEHDRFSAFATGSQASLYEHCLRAFDRAFRLGGRGLPLMGDGDWNDGMNRVGAGGRGESVWLAWFLAATIRDFAAMSEATGRTDFGPRWLPRRDQLIAAVERHGWDGEWYMRAFDDQSRPWGSRTNDECRIDALVQSWAVIAGGNKTRAKQAIASAFDRLVKDGDSLARLLDPPFNRTARDPGYIKAYPPGIRENGGQYSHAAAWLGIACAMLGDGAKAKEVFDRINPIRHSDSREKAATYAIEPYAVAGDISGGDEHLGRGGWSWYTGAAGWAWRLGAEHILGIRQQAGRIAIDPCLPPDWPAYSATLRGDGTIEIAVSRGDAAQCKVDGQSGDALSVAFPGKGRTTRVEITVAPQAPAERSAPADAQA